MKKIHSMFASSFCRYWPLTVFGLAAFLLAIFAADIYRRVSARRHYPESIYVDFLDRKGKAFYRHTIVQRNHIPVDPAGLLPESKRQINRFFNDQFRKTRAGKMVFVFTKSTEGLALAFFSAPVITNDASSRNIQKRLRHYVTALWMAVFYSVDTRLYLLLNWRPHYYRAYGVGIAARAMFGKDFSELSPEETEKVLAFVYGGVLDPGKRHKAKAALFRVCQTRPNKTVGGHFIDYALSLLESTKLRQFHQSLRVHTTIDIAFQKKLEQSAARYIRVFKDQSEGRKRILSRLDPIELAVVAVDIQQGGIIGMLGGVSYNGAVPYNRAVQAKRQISSTFKPFLYALAFESGIRPDRVFEDKPVHLKNRDGTPWTPKNYYPYYIGKVTLRRALVDSINTVSVQLMEVVGLTALTSLAQNVFAMPGNQIRRRIQPEYSLSLGAIDLTPLELARGYLILAGGGMDRQPCPVIQVSDLSGQVLLTRKDLAGSWKTARALFKRQTVLTITDILKGVVREGTASSFHVKAPSVDLAGKSGSSAHDSWFAGYSAKTLIVTWAGYDRPSSVKKGEIPLFTIIPLWFHLMAAAEETP